MARIFWRRDAWSRAFVAGLRASPDAVGGPAYVQQTDDGYDVIDRESGDVVASHAKLKPALASLLEFDAFGSALKSPVLRGEESEPVGVWRWLDASAVEAAPMADGSQITAEAIRTMVDRLNASQQPIMIDGGSDDSDPHASLKATDTRANGFAHVAAEWRETGGREHLALYVELLPDVAPDVDSGRLAFGSIGFAQDPDNLADAALWSHALTNMPAVTGLQPSSALRTQLGSRVFARARPNRSQIMAKTKTSARGPAASKFDEIRTMLGIGAEVEENDVVWAMHDVICVLKQGATLEKILEGGGAATLAKKTDETDEAHAARIEALKPVAPVARAVEGFDSPEAVDAFAADVVAVLREVLGMADAAPAALIDGLKAGADKIKGALAAAPVAEEAAPTDGSAPARAVTIGLESKIATLSKRADESEARAAKLEGEVARRDLRDAVTARFATAKLVLADAARDELVDMAMRAPEQDREKLIDLSLRAANVPPSGRAITDVPSPTQIAGGAPDPDAMYRAALEALAKEHPEWTRTQRSAEAYARSRAAFAQAQRGN